jgi:D-alanyl-lipoteichoic acid acyltransferase DltB (MBOAT superfamily)
VIFHSLDFVAFFVAVVAIYWRLPQRGQNLLLLVASYVFYGYVHPWFLLLIATSTTIDYAAARGMETWPHYRRRFLALSIVSNFGMLGFFKYFNFFVGNAEALLHAVGLSASGPMVRIILPVGISFYTFQAMSYTIDVYRGELRARRSLLDLAVFISFFPHLVAGPIQRATYLLPQVEAKRRFSTEKARSGFVLICWGFFKKLVIADNVGIIANKVFALADPTFYILWAGVFAFAVQIYADFSAYTDIARGTSRWLGFELTENFNHPYLARRPADFWHRWNISLSTWFRDYVYIPLGGSRGSRWQWARNVLVTFVLSGLWHGASWNYVLWGAYHGVLLILTSVESGFSRTRSVESGFSRTRPVVSGFSRTQPMKIAATFVLTNIGWLIFRETEVTAIWRDLTLSPFGVSALDMQTGVYLLLLASLYSLPLWIQSVWVETARVRAETSDASSSWGQVAVQGVACGLALVAILILRSRTSLDFIYFQF